MTREEQRVYRRVLYYRRLMGLLGWEVRVSFGTDEEESLGKAHVANQYKEVDLTLDLKAHKEPDRNIDGTIRHELAHALLGPLSAFTMNLCKKDKMLLNMLDEVEDEVATHIERMKVWRG